MIIRPATSADLPQLIALLQQEIAYQRQISPFFDLAPDFDWTQFAKTKLNNPNERIMVAEDQGRLLGYIDVRVLPPTIPLPRPKSIRERFSRRRVSHALGRPWTIGWIEDCYVESRFRQQGTGTALVKAGVAWLQARGANRMELAVSAANSGGRVFWEKQGFAVSRLQMLKDPAYPAEDCA